MLETRALGIQCLEENRKLGMCLQRVCIYVGKVNLRATPRAKTLQRATQSRKGRENLPSRSNGNPFIAANTMCKVMTTVRVSPEDSPHMDTSSK